MVSSFGGRLCWIVTKLIADVSMVPVQDLPLQTALDFRACPVPLAVSYLQLLSLSHSRVVDHHVIERLYQDSCDHLGCSIDRLLHPRHAPLAIPDLRRAINHLQLGAASSTGQKPALTDDDDQSLARFKRMARAAELCSFADSGLRRPQPEVLQVSPPERFCRTKHSSISTIRTCWRTARRLARMTSQESGTSRQSLATSLPTYQSHSPHMTATT